MFTKIFFKLFPPPKYINIPYAGLDISDDAIRCIEYKDGSHGYTLKSYGYRNLKPGIIDSGYIKDEKTLIEEIKILVNELKISTVKVTLPEERMYLFKAQVPDSDEDEIRQNIEFKLEENVPLKASESVFFFDHLPLKPSNGLTSVSVSVAPRDLVNSYLRALQTVGLSVVSFEIQAKAIARSIVSSGSDDIQLIVNVMNKKTGLYIVSGSVVCFTSTISWGGESIRNIENGDMKSVTNQLKHEIARVCAYWMEYGEGRKIKSIVISGRDALVLSKISDLSPDPEIQLRSSDVWQNAFSISHYVPKIPFEESLDYAAAAGLALP
jgi:Tfp pilus assembly PilM family ATPase